MSFVHLHAHSHYSLLEAFGEPKALIARAKALGMNAIALTDYNGMYGAIEFYQAAKKADIKAIFGVELGFVQERLRKDKSESAGNIVLLAKNMTGYQNLMALTTDAHIEGYFKKARIDYAILRKYQSDLVALVGWHNSRLGQAILQQEETTKIYERLHMLQEILWAENVYWEIIVQDERIIPELKTINGWLIEHAAALNLSLVCASGFNYPTPEDKELCEILLCIKEWQRYSDRDKQLTRGERYMHSEEDIQNILTKNGYSSAQIEWFLSNTIAVAEQLNVDIKLGQMLFPKYTSSPEITALYATHKDELIVHS